MPKIIPHLRETLLETAKQQVAEHGYAGMTIRSVAAACGVGLGTVYNYFPSKDVLVASFMLEDWQLCLSAMAASAKDADRPEPVLRCVYDELRRYIAQHTRLFEDPKARETFSAVFNERHPQLRGQIAGILRPLCDRYAKEPSAFLPEFIAESLLSWTSADRSFDELHTILKQFFK